MTFGYSLFSSAGLESTVHRSSPRGSRDNCWAGNFVQTSFTFSRFVRSTGNLSAEDDMNAVNCTVIEERNRGATQW